MCICITCIYAHTHIYIHCSVSNLTRYNQSLKSKKLYILKPSSSTPNNAKNSSTTCGKEQKQNKNTNGVIGSVSLLLCDCPHSQSDSNVPRVLGVWAGRGSTIWEEAFARQVREAKLWILILSLTVSSGGSEHSLYPWCGFPMAALTNDHKPSGLKNRNVFSHSSGSQKSKLKVLAKPSSLQRF